MKLLKLESNELSAVVELSPNAAGVVEGTHNSYEDTVYLIVPDGVSVKDLLYKHFESKGWDEESIESVLDDVTE